MIVNILKKNNLMTTQEKINNLLVKKGVKTLKELRSIQNTPTAQQLNIEYDIKCEKCDGRITVTELIFCEKNKFPKYTCYNCNTNNKLK